ncbi:MAG: hypothetical protein OSJ71_06465 [Acetatifactor sp.]|nr:hypothetical protein [Acetatifactor sp.]
MMKKEQEFNEILVSSKVLESLFSLKDRSIRDLADKGIVKRDSHGKYLLWESAKSYITFLKVINAGKNNRSSVAEDGESIDLEEEKAQHERLKRQITEIKLQLIRGQTHKSEDVERVMTDMFARFKSKMAALPAKLARRLENKKRSDIQSILRKEIDSALIELAAYSPADFYSDEHIEIRNEDLETLLEGEDDAKGS